jgi:hypothetical protein
LLGVFVARLGHLDVLLVVLDAVSAVAECTEEEAVAVGR